MLVQSVRFGGWEKKLTWNSKVLKWLKSCIRISPFSDFCSHEVYRYCVVNSTVIQESPRIDGIHSYHDARITHPSGEEGGVLGVLRVPGTRIPPSAIIIKLLSL